MSSETFEIVIKGAVSPELSAAFLDFDVTTHVVNGRTYLIGAIQDQGKLHGLLEMLSSLNIELISVNPIVAPETP